MEHESFQSYELAYHITTQLEDADVQKTAQEVEKIVSSKGARVTFTKDPVKTRLSYPIKHQQYANFGHIHFELEDKDKLPAINEQLRLSGNILRFLLTKLNLQTDKEKDLIRKIALESRRGRVKPTFRPVAPKPKPKTPPVKEEELDKQIEDIIEKI